MPHVAIDGLGVGPVGLDGDDVEAVVGDEVFCQLGAGGVEFRGAVGGVADEDDFGGRSQEGGGELVEGGGGFGEGRQGEEGGLQEGESGV